MRILLFSLIVFVTACTNAQQKPPEKKPAAHTGPTAQALFAGGCFWCMEPPFDKIPGVISTTSGFAGGKEVKPTYKQVASGSTGHVEAVLIVYDPQKVTYKTLLDTYWRQIDPTDSGGQFVDRGAQYRPVIFYFDETQKKAIEVSQTELEKLDKFSKPIVVEKLPYTSFYPAEEYHQDYYQKSSFKYKFYRSRSGRDQFLEKIWGK